MFSWIFPWPKCWGFWWLCRCLLHLSLVTVTCPSLPGQMGQWSWSESVPCPFCWSTWRIQGLFGRRCWTQGLRRYRGTRTRPGTGILIWVGSLHELPEWCRIWLLLPRVSCSIQDSRWLKGFQGCRKAWRLGRFYRTDEQFQSTINKFFQAFLEYRSLV